MSPFFDPLPVLDFLAELYASDGKRRDEAISVRRRVASILEHNQAPTSLRVTSLNNLGQLYNEMGKFSDAIEMFTKALALLEADKTSPQLSYAAQLNHLSYVYKALVSLALTDTAGEPRPDQGFAVATSVGPGTVELAAISANLADVYTYQAKYKEAETLYKSAIEIYEKHYQGVGEVAR